MTHFSAPGDPPATWEAERSALAADSLRNSGRLRLQVRGESMLPSLWPGDLVEIASCSIGDVRPGEIVLALREGRLFLHRFLARLPADSFLLRGDSMPGPDLQFPNEALIGRLVGCARQSEGQIGNRDRARPVLPLRPWSWAIGQLLCHWGPARSFALRLQDRQRRRREIPNPEGAAGPGTISLGAINVGTVDPGAS